jgi:hypothetical protein
MVELAETKASRRPGEVRLPKHRGHREKSESAHTSSIAASATLLHRHHRHKHLLDMQGHTWGLVASLLSSTAEVYKAATMSRNRAWHDGARRYWHTIQGAHPSV